MLVRTALLLACWVASCSLTPCLRAEAISLNEAPTDLRVFRVQSQVVTRGRLVVSEGAGKTQDLPIESQATFSFRERRLPPAGRDALAFRAVREFETASMHATIDGEKVTLDLPSASALVVSSGRLDGLQNYSLRTLLTDDHVDLLNLLADPLALSALLPAGAVDAESEWLAPEWVAQLLGTVEAVESARLGLKLVGHDTATARLHLDGVVQGLQEGARTTVTLNGEITFDIAARHIRAAKLTYKIQADIGAVAPGVDAEATVTVIRQPTSDAGRITDNVVAAIPLEAPAESLQLVFDAPPWRSRVRYDREWHVFRAVLDAPPRVAILRLIEQGSLVCQCNISPIPDAAPGRHTPMDQYQQDIRMVLGKSLREIQSSEEVPLANGGTRISVSALGEVERTGKDKDGQTTVLAIPMEWRYSIIADRSGRQMSFVFAVEQALAEQLGRRDLDLIESLEFLR